MASIRSETSTGRALAAHGDWRRRRLLAAGFDAPLASALAGDERIDVHQLLVLRDRGCPPRLAARIVAPLGAPVRDA